MKKKIIVVKIVWGAIVVFISFSLLAFLGIHIAYTKVFSRADYSGYDKSKYLIYKDVSSSYPRETIKVSSGTNKLTGYIYGAENSKGLIVVSPGLGDSNDIKLYEIMHFVDAGWTVLCYDYTGCYNSEGDNKVSYTQSVADLDSILDYVESEKRFSNLPVMLFGHSLGAYASTAVLQYGHRVTAVVAASGFNDPTEQWEYSIEKYTGVFGRVLKPYAMIYMSIKLKNEAHLSAIDGINSTNIPVFVISGTEDEYYGGRSRIYEGRSSITNHSCTFRLMTNKNHCGHYDYFLTDAAIAYQKLVDSGRYKKPINKMLYMEHEKKLMDDINDFFTNAIQAK